MSTLLRGLRACLLGVMALVALAALALLLGRAWVKREGPPPPVQAALAALQATPPEPAGPNGAVWLHLAPLALPEGFDDAQARALVSKDLQHLQAHRAEIMQRFGDVPADAFEQSLREVASELPSRQAFALRPSVPTGAAQAKAPLACNGSTCLDAVRAQTSAYAAALAQATSPALQQVLTATHWRSLSAEAEVLQQPWSLLRWPSTQAAFDFAQGRAQPAVDALCRHALQLRRLGDDADAALDAFTLSRETLQAGDLLMRMLREAPTAVAGPDCQAAFAPNAKTAQACRFARRMAQEFAVIQSQAKAKAQDRWWNTLSSWSVMDESLSQWDEAMIWHGLCSPRALALSAQPVASETAMREALSTPEVTPAWLNLEPSFLRPFQTDLAVYLQKPLLDADAQRHALANWLWLHQRGQAHAAALRATGKTVASIPRAQWQSWLNQRPTELRDTHRALVLSKGDDAPALQVQVWLPRQALRSRCPGKSDKDEGERDVLSLPLQAWPAGQPVCTPR